MLGAPVIGVGLLMSSFLGVENHPEKRMMISFNTNDFMMVMTINTKTGAPDTTASFRGALCKRVLVLSTAATVCIFVLVMAFAKSITVIFGVDGCQPYT